VKTFLFGSVYSFHVEPHDACSMKHAISDIVPTCNDKFIAVLQKFVSVSILEYDGFGALPAELKH
jgi:hypothetical protein